MKAESTFKTEVIPAGQSKTYTITGRAFYIQNSTGLVDVQFDDNPNCRMSSGQTAEAPDGDPGFERFTLTNPDTASSVTVTFYAGTLSIGTRTPYVFTKPSPTYLVGTAYTGGSQITTAADVTIPSTNLRSGKSVADSRAYCIIFARSSTSGLLVKDSAGTICGYVQTMTAWQITTSDAIKIRADAASMDVYVANFFNYDS